MESSRANQDIIAVAARKSNLSTFIHVIQAAGLVDTLKGPGPFTVFAPTNVAFGKLPAGTLNNLLKPENKNRLKAVFAYHITGTHLLSTDLKAAGQHERLATEEGSSLTVKWDGNTAVPTSNWMVNNAHIVQSDIKAGNGVIDVIDTVLMPPGFK